MSSLALLIPLIFARTLLVLHTRTFFQPDEHYQSLEIAHRLVFGYGYQTWEWRDTRPADLPFVESLVNGPIRSIAFPAVFVPAYGALKWMGLDETVLLTLAPKLVQAAIASLCDISTYVLAKRLFGSRYAPAAALLSITSFFNIISLGRTVSNSLETSLTVTALCFWPHVPGRSRRDLRISLILAALAVAMRPTNAVLWFFLGAELLCQPRLPRLAVVLDSILIGVLSSILLFALDTAFYRRPTFTPLSFLAQNVFRSISLFYGSSPAHYYLTQGLPLLCLTSLPFALIGLIRASSPFAPRAARTLAALVAWTVGIYSLLAHKEWRFLHPILPVLHVLAARALVDAYARVEERAKEPEANPRAMDGYIHTTSELPVTPLPRRRPPPFPSSLPVLSGVCAKLRILPAHLALLLLALPPALYLARYHMHGQTEIMHVLRELTEEPAEQVKSVGLLMPCHSTPWQATLHLRELEVEGGQGPNWSGDGGKLWFLTCDPPLDGQDATTYADQSDQFYASPATYLSTHFPPTVEPSFLPSPFPTSSPSSLSSPSSTSISEQEHTWPSHLVLFSALLDEPGVHALLQERGYVERRRVWNSRVHEDARRSGDVVVLRWEGKTGRVD